MPAAYAAAGGLVLFAATAHASRQSARKPVQHASSDPEPATSQRAMKRVQLGIPEVRDASCLDVLRTLKQAQPLKLPQLATSSASSSSSSSSDIDALFEGADAQMVYPGNRLSVERIFRTVPLSSLRTNIADELRRLGPRHPLASIPDEWWTSQAIAQRIAAHRRCELYGMAAVANLGETLQQRLNAACSAVLALTTPHWKAVSMNLWVGASSGSLHYDERDNVLLQLSGSKRVLLFPIEYTGMAKLHSILSRLPNHSSYNAAFFADEAVRQHPNGISSAPCYEVVLRPGDALVIPAGVLHAPIGALDSVSVNLFLKDGPSPSKHSWWLRTRFQLSVAARSVFNLHLPHIGGGTLRFKAAERQQSSGHAGPSLVSSATTNSAGVGLTPRSKSLAVVTGASQGIGLAICQQLAQQGNFDVLAVCRNFSDELRELQQRFHVEVVSNVDFLRSGDVVCAAVDQALRRRPVALLIHCAAMGSQESMNDVSGARTDYGLLEQMFRLHCVVPLMLTNHLADQGLLGAETNMMAKIVLLGSNLGSIGLVPTLPALFVGYRLSKSAMNMAAALLAKTLAAKQVAVAVVHPGATHTAMTRAAVGPKVAVGFQSPASAASSVLRVVDQLHLQNTGKFWDAGAPGSDVRNDAKFLPW
eukprot:INCI17128.2.p1 GENE.INCI17128.2~~INCI17128.2.p1  ORF type:complete len:646 (+),score=111.40 INCI17128.2:353-2290(+)